MEEKEKRAAANRRQNELRKEARRINREKKQKGLQGTKRLAFLENIIHSSGYTTAEIARMLGCTQQNLYYTFSVKDGCRASRVEEILALLGLCFRFEFVTPKAIKLEPSSYNNNGVVNTVRLPEGHQAGKLGRNAAVSLPDYILDYPDGGRLSSLRDMISGYGQSVNAFEDRIEVSHGTIRGIFAADDIHTDTIYQIAEKTGSQIIWDISQADKPETQSEG